MTRIQFRYDRDKFVQALAYFSTHGISDLTKMKAAKLLYFADKYHLTRYARPVIGDRYACLDHGPVPSHSLDLMNEAIQPSGRPGPNAEALLKSVEVVRAPGEYPIFRARGDVDQSVFSESDIEALDYAIREFGTYSGWQLRNMTHDENSWKVADKRRPVGSSVDMPYELFFDDSPGQQEMLRLVESDQEHRDFVQAIRES